MVPTVAPSAAHSSNYKRMRKRMPRFEKDMKRLNMMQQNPEHAKKLHASLALRQNFLNQQESINVLNEIDRLKGRLSLYRHLSVCRRQCRRY